MNQNTFIPEGSSIPATGSTSFAVVAIPTDPLYSSVAKASLQITEEVDNLNIIDNQRFPCHLSLLLAGTSTDGMVLLRSLIADVVPAVPIPAVARSIATSGNGLISVTIESAAISELHTQVIAANANVMNQFPYIRPHLHDRWVGLSEQQRAAVQLFGSYHVEASFFPHLSVAQVDREDLREMAAIARKTIVLPADIAFREIQIVDVGHKNEKWEVLESFSIL
jgi:hypothetical protein